MKGRARSSPPLIICLLIGMLLPAIAYGGGEESGISGEPIDPALVQAKIGALGLRDDSLPPQERPEYWLKERREKLLPQLIAALDHPEKRIATGSLQILNEVREYPALVDVLVRIARDREHLIRSAATLSLSPYAEEEQVREVLTEALSDGGRIPGPRDRASVALALDRKAEAAGLLIALLDPSVRDSEIITDIRRLGEIGHPSALVPLEEVAGEPIWSVAVEAYLAMAEIDPAGHGLTEDQRIFITDVRGRFKAGWRRHVEHWQALAALNRAEIRPFVIRMLSSDRSDAALTILQEWRDREALPEIRRLMTGGNRRIDNGFAAAYLHIEGTERSIIEVISILKGSGDGKDRSRTSRYSLEAERLLQTVARSSMSNDRKLAVFKVFRDVPDERNRLLVAKAIGWLPRNDSDIAPILRPLLREETDLAALGIYVQMAANDPQKRFSKEIAEALEKLAGMKKYNASEDPGAARSILDAVFASKVPDSGRLTDRLLGHSALKVRLAAARISATLGGDRQKALQVLYDALNSEKAEFRHQSSASLMTIPCAGQTEREVRESILLAHLGKESEDYALRVLTTCQGERTVEKLAPLLDEIDVQRAVYAAWVLAQHPQEDAGRKGERRLALYALFQHQAYQASSGIDFFIAPHLSFHQVISRLNPTSYRSSEEDALQLSPDLLNPFPIDEMEQAFVVRAYRYTRIERRPAYLYNFEGRGKPHVDWDVSHVPLLQVIAREDPYLVCFYVRGRKIPHFPYRRTAAQIIAWVRKERTSYTALNGEAIDSEEVPPQPYRNQNTLIAAYLLDQIEEGQFGGRPRSDREWGRHGAYAQHIRRLVGSDYQEGFGVELKEALLAESRRRGLTAGLKAAGFSIWREPEK